ncbi:MAG: hypothetical protein Q9164_001252 [Protoblastenia rupestris]
MPQLQLRVAPFVLLTAILVITAIFFAANPPYRHNAASLLSFNYHAKASQYLNEAQNIQAEALGLHPGSKASLKSSPSSLASVTKTRPNGNPISKYAFVSFLQENALHDETKDPNDDEYFLSVRVLGYQLMHSPQTGTNTSIPFVVCVTHEVSEKKKKILESDGATVIVVDAVPNPDWLSTNGVKARWKDLMTKLRVFQLVQFEKILLLDSDQLIVKRMDGIFHDPGTMPIQPKEGKFAGRQEASLPQKYMLAAQAQQRDWIHPYPPAPDNNYFGAGFFMALPSHEIFDYYNSVLQIKGLFDPDMMEQNLLNYAHRRDGPMPWTDVYYTWTTTFPTISDYNSGGGTIPILQHLEGTS